MNGMALFAFVVMPVVIVAIGWTAVLLHERQAKRRDMLGK
jgi:hypothetical protein